MSETVPSGTNRDENVMTEYVFLCVECEQEIDVNGEMKRAIEENGCPVCSATVSEDSFTE